MVGVRPRRNCSGKVRHLGTWECPTRCHRGAVGGAGMWGNQSPPVAGGGGAAVWGHGVMRWSQVEGSIRQSKPSSGSCSCAFAFFKPLLSPEARLIYVMECLVPMSSSSSSHFHFLQRYFHYFSLLDYFHFFLSFSLFSDACSSAGACACFPPRYENTIIYHSSIDSSRHAIERRPGIAAGYEGTSFAVCRAAPGGPPQMPATRWLNIS